MRVARNLKAWLPVCVLGLWPVTRTVAVFERVAARDASATIALLAGFGFVAVRQAFGCLHGHSVRVTGQHWSPT
jgi:hypothetical protein